MHCSDALTCKLYGGETPVIIARMVKRRNPYVFLDTLKVRLKGHGIGKVFSDWVFACCRP